MTVGCDTPSSPITLTDGSRTTIVVMPMFVQWDGDPAAPPQEQTDSAEAQAPPEGEDEATDETAEAEAPEEQKPKQKPVRRRRRKA